MGLLDNLGLSGLGNSLSNFRTNIDDQTGGLLTRLGQPDNQANLIAAASLFGAGLVGAAGLVGKSFNKKKAEDNAQRGDDQKDRQVVDGLEEGANNKQNFKTIFYHKKAYLVN